MSRRWNADDVRPITEERSRFQHVAKHLYSPEEKWDQVIPGLGDARGAAWAAGCPEAVLDRKYPDCDDVPECCREHVLRDHDDLMAPAYLEATRRAEEAGRWARLEGDRSGYCFVGDDGVFVIVRETGRKKTPEVKTAYRVVPLWGRRTQDYFKAAVRRLRDKASSLDGE